MGCCGLLLLWVVVVVGCCCSGLVFFGWEVDHATRVSLFRLIFGWYLFIYLFFFSPLFRSPLHVDYQVRHSHFQESIEKARDAGKLVEADSLYRIAEAHFLKEVLLVDGR